MRRSRDLNSLQLIHLQHDVAEINSRKGEEPKIYLPDVSVEDLTTTDSGCGGAAATQIGTRWYRKFLRK